MKKNDVIKTGLALIGVMTISYTVCYKIGFYITSKIINKERRN